MASKSRKAPEDSKNDQPGSCGESEPKEPIPDDLLLVAFQSTCASLGLDPKSSIGRLSELLAAGASKKSSEVVEEGAGAGADLASSKPQNERADAKSANEERRDPEAASSNSVDVQREDSMDLSSGEPPSAQPESAVQVEPCTNLPAPLAESKTMQGTSGYWVRDANMKKRWVSSDEADELYEKKYASSSVEPMVIQIPDDNSPVKVEDFLIGRKVRKLFESGYFNGIVIKYKPKKKFYLIRYEDDDEEEMDEAELNEYLVDDEEALDQVDDEKNSNDVAIVDDAAEDKEDEADSDEVSTDDDSDKHEENTEDAEKRKEEAKKNRQQKLKGRKNSKKAGGSNSDSEFELEEDEDEEDDLEEISSEDESDEDFVAEKFLRPARKESHKIVTLVRRSIESADGSKTKMPSEEDEDLDLSDDVAAKKASKCKTKKGDSSGSDSGRGRHGSKAKTGAKRGNVEEESDEDSDVPFAKRRTRNSRKSDGPKKGRRRKKASDSESRNSSDEDVPKKPKKASRRVRPAESESEESSESDGKSVEIVEGPRRKRIRKDEELSEAQKRAAKEGLEADRRRVCLRELPEEIQKCLPETVTQNLQDHQREGLIFMWSNVNEEKGGNDRGCILAHCMGLGKTLQVVALCQAWLQIRGHKSAAQKAGGGSDLAAAAASPAKSKAGQQADGEARPHTVLIIGPVNTLLNWVAEFDKWLPVRDEPDRSSWARRSARSVGGLRYPAVFLMADAGSKVHDQVELLEEWTAKGGILLIGYEQYRNLTGLKCRTPKNKSDKEGIRRMLVAPGPHMVICDEGHVLRNAKSGLSMALAEIQTRRRVVLTGTPLQNNMREYHCMINFVRPGLLKTEREFVRDFVSPILNGQCVDSTPADVKRMKFRISVLGKILKGVVDRKDYSVLKDYLPPKYEYVIAVRLSRLQAQLYVRYLEFIGAREAVRAAGSAPPDAAAAMLAKPRALVFEAFHSLARVWTHPGVLEMDNSDLRSRGAGGGGGRGRGGYTSMDDFIASSEDDDDWSDEEERRKRRRRQQLKKAKEKKSKAALTKEDSAEGSPEPAPPAKAAGESWWGSLLEKVAVTAKALGASCVEPYEPGTSGKLLFLMEVLARAREAEEKVLVFSQSLLMIELIERCLEGLDGGVWKLGSTYFRLDGSTDKDTRQAWIDRFNEHARARLFLISTRAGGLGVNLVAANRVVIMDASWNPSHDHQAVFRAYRFGQTRPVYIYRLVAHGTMEEKVYNRQITKQDLASRVVDRDKDEQFGRYFTDEDLRRLYDYDADAKTAEDFADGAAAAAAAAPAAPAGAEEAGGKKMFSYIGLPTRDDKALSGILRKLKPQWIVGYHPTDSLVDATDAKLTEEEELAAWADYERVEAAEEQARAAAREAERAQRSAAAQARAAAARAGPAPMALRVGDRPMTAYEVQMAFQRQLVQIPGVLGGGVQMGLPQMHTLTAEQAQAQFLLYQQRAREELLRQQQQQQAQQTNAFLLYHQQQQQMAAQARAPAGAGGAGAWSEAQLSAMPTALARPAALDPKGRGPP